MNRTIFIIILTLLPCCFSNLMAQGTLHGRILSSGGGGVEYATVGVVDSRTPHGATADDRGFYSLTVRETDSVTLRISCSGYETQTLRLRLTKGEKRRLDLTLKPSSTQLDPVTVSDDRIRSTTFTQIDIKRIENSIGPNEGVESYIKTLPDVSSNNELSSQYSVRGGSFDENLVYINGVEPTSSTTCSSPPAASMPPTATACPPSSTSSTADPSSNATASPSPFWAARPPRRAP